MIIYKHLSQNIKVMNISEKQLYNSFDAESVLTSKNERKYTTCKRLDGLKALVVGADSSIGRAVSLTYAQEGTDLALVYQPENTAIINRLYDNLEETGCEALLFPKYLTDEIQCVEMVKSVMQSFGHVDIVVFARQSSNEACDIGNLTTERLQKIFDSNIFSLFWIVKAVHPYMKLGTSIIVTSSYQVYQPDANFCDYAAAKAAVMGLSRGLAKQMWTDGIRLNIVVPLPASKKNAWANSFSLYSKEIQQPIDICQVYVSLASKESRYVTAEVYNVVCNIPCV